MKNLYRILIGVYAIFVLFSCDYERINTNPYEMTEEEGKMDGIALGAHFTLMERSVFPVGTQADKTYYINNYQTAYLLSADGWSGYFGEDNNWFSGQNQLTYYLQNDWNASTYKESYTNLLPSWKKIKSKAEENGTPEVFAAAQIIKISAWHKTLEAFGPIPYTQAGAMALVIPFDSEQEVYTAMFNDLKSAIEILTPFAEQGGRVMANYDIVYAGDASKWVKYARSLMLRLAMRLKYCNPDMSKQWALEAYSNNPALLMNAKEDEAQISTGAGYVFVNNINHCAQSYQECCMCTSMYAYLNGYKDPRLAKYFTNTDDAKTEKGEPVPWKLSAFDGKKYSPVPPGTANPPKTFSGASKPNFTSATPTYWMRTSEVFFLLAEAALSWPEFGSAADWYRKGIEMSFEENGIAVSELENYISSENTPASVDVKFSNVNYSAQAPTTASTAFASGNSELALEQIMIQKWIALYPNGMEAWTEWRRTGYPKLNPVAVNASPEGATKEGGIRRMVYPISFSQSQEDAENYQDALKKLGGEDRSTTRLWWDKR